MSSTHAADHDHDHGHGHEDHHELGFWQKYVFSQDHKVIGIQYAITGLAFLFLGFSLMMIMRWQLAYPGQPVPIIGPLLQTLFGPTVFTEHAQTHIKGVLTAEGYNTFGAMHGTIMVFFGVVPVAVAAFGNFVMPLQVGAPDMAFPKLNMASYWTFFVSCVIMMSSFLVPGSAAKSGWTSYPPLSILNDSGPNVWSV